MPFRQILALFALGLSCFVAGAALKPNLVDFSYRIAGVFSDTPASVSDTSGDPAVLSPSGTSTALDQSPYSPATGNPMPGRLSAAPTDPLDATEWPHEASPPFSGVIADDLGPDRSRPVEVTVTKGQTLATIFAGLGYSPLQAHDVAQSLREILSPRALTIGTVITVSLSEDENNIGTVTIRRPGDLKTYIVSYTDEGTYRAFIDKAAVRTRLVAVGGTISRSLYEDAVHAGAPIEILHRVAKLLSFEVDFQRDIQPGTSFRILYEAVELDSEPEAGEVVGFGSVLLFSIEGSATAARFYSFPLDDGEIAFFNRKGHSIERFLLSTPIDGARVSSGFGKRKHPILGYTKMHKGMDFAAPSGTPIYAAGSGTVEIAGRNGSYGNYVRIRHSSDMKTAYAHLKSFAKGIRKGTRVSQGQVIGYVGSTGRSTGPHLHYEVLQGGRQVNPRSVTSTHTRTLRGKSLTRFLSLADELDALFENTLAGQPLKS